MTQAQSIERRSVQRYKLALPITGYIEHDFTRFRGQVLDVSISGFQLFIPGLAADNFAEASPSDFGEVRFGEMAADGFGQIVVARPIPGGVAVGFHWDKFAFHGGGSAMGTIIDRLLELKAAGSVARRGKEIWLLGHVSNALASDVFSAIAAGGARICLAQCNSIDSGGRDLLVILSGVGIPIESIPPEIHAVFWQV
jgi:hypothetical protein